MKENWKTTNEVEWN